MVVCELHSTEQNYQEVYQYFSEKLGKIKSKCRQRSNKNGADMYLSLCIHIISILPNSKNDLGGIGI